MDPKRILVTGGAGFIGSHLVDALVERGHRVRVLDNLDPQVHGEAAEPVSIGGHLKSGAVEFLHGDVRDPEAVAAALRDIDLVSHQAAAVGVGQSMYRISDYVQANCEGTGILLQAIIDRERPIERLVVASSMSIYGEGQYRCEAHGTLYPPLRPVAQLERGDWEMRCPACDAVLAPAPTPEEKPLHPTSVYAVSKRDQEELCLSVGGAYGIPTVALRYFNVYGPRQSLNNPYTGVAAIFTCRLLNRRAPVVFEDGVQSRDFVHVSDIVEANLLALEPNRAAGEAVNVCTGRSLGLRELTNALRDRLGGPEPEYADRFRKGDIRHCYGDPEKARDLLGFEARVRFEDGIDDLAAWAEGQEAVDRVDVARRELEEAGLTV
ncbi:MAG: NAD-dependent epimerase/dehydratase family protein [marine benthic group bacterium]|nr:NAD-dependent epimerase/dehydratase family protein [Gemmatimonadota bacterium]